MEIFEKLVQFQFYIGIYLLACFAGVARTFRDHLYSNVWNLLSVGICSGFIGLGCITMLTWISGTSVGHEPGLVAVSIFLGLLGKEADKYIPKILEAILYRFGLKFNKQD
jgi:hypothetical protein